MSIPTTGDAYSHGSSDGSPPSFLLSAPNAVVEAGWRCLSRSVRHDPSLFQDLFNQSSLHETERLLADLSDIDSKEVLHALPSASTSA
jgi:hypothetical protein